MQLSARGLACRNQETTKTQHHTAKSQLRQFKIEHDQTASQRRASVNSGGRNSILRHDDTTSDGRLRMAHRLGKIDRQITLYQDGTQTDGFCIKSDGFCIKSDGLRTKNDGFCIKRWDAEGKM